MNKIDWKDNAESKRHHGENKPQLNTPLENIPEQETVMVPRQLSHGQIIYEKHVVDAQAHISAPHTHDSAKNEVAQENEAADGKYRLVRCAAIRTEGEHAFEAGKINLVDPHGKVIFSAPYSAGGPAGRAMSFVDKHIADHSEAADLYATSKGENGSTVHVIYSLRVGKKSEHTLIHEDFNSATSMMCFHVDYADAQKLCKRWDKIPDDKKSLVLHAEKDPSNTAFKEAVAMIESKGMCLSEADGRQHFVMNTQHERSGHVGKTPAI